MRVRLDGLPGIPFWEAPPMLGPERFLCLYLGCQTGKSERVPWLKPQGLTEAISRNITEQLFHEIIFSPFGMW
ncbi:MAG: hypothetical protein ACPGVU_25010 [Limisphaerales bacterium]